MTIYSGLNEPINNSPGWDIPLNNNFTIIDGYLTQSVTLTVTTSDVTLTNPSSTPNTGSLGQVQSYLIIVTGALTGNRSVIIPNGNRGRWIIANNTTDSPATGPWTITVKTDVTGATVVVPRQYSTTVFCDGTNVYLADNGILNGGFAASFGALVATSVTGRPTPRVVQGTTSAAVQSPNADTTDQYEINGLSTAITTFNAPSGTPVDGQKMIIRLLDNGTARAISGWSSSYATIGTTLPTTTVAGKYLYVGCVYNSNSSKWDVVAVATQV
jgi:hypothetical protein